MNITVLTGRLVYEPEIKTAENGFVFLPMRIAVPRNDKEKNTDFINVRALKQTAEFIAKYFHKSDPIEITGKLRTNSFTKKDGTQVNETYVLITEVNFVQSKGQKSEAAAEEPKKEDLPSGLPFEL